jgi:hypothetical protein
LGALFIKALCCSVMVFLVIGMCAVWLRRRRGR